MKYLKSMFASMAQWAGDVTGSPLAFVLSVAAIAVWGVTGPVFGFSDTWQLIINTSTTVITFLMIFLLQATQNRNTKAMQKKMDELIRVNAKAHNELMGLENKEISKVEEVEENMEEVDNNTEGKE